MERVSSDMKDHQMSVYLNKQPLAGHAGAFVTGSARDLPPACSDFPNQEEPQAPQAFKPGSCGRRLLACAFWKTSKQTCC